VIRTVDVLEKAFATGLVPPDEYEKNCNQLLTQFKVLQAALKDIYPNLTDFMVKYKMDVPFAKVRLFGTQVAATRMYQGDSKRPEVVHILEAGQHFVTLVDSLKLELVHVDDILPLLRELSSSLAGIPSLPANFDAKEITQRWLVKLNGMRAADRLSLNDTRQMSMDLDSAYSSFHKAVSNIK
jgi:hypothetical protein